MVYINVTVVSGRGMAAELRSKETAELSNQLGTTLVSGSLNLVAKKPLWLDSKSAVFSSDEGHLYWRATLEGLPVIVNRWVDCPAHVFEIYANTRLRETLKLEDGYVVRLALDRGIVNEEKGKSIIYVLTWYLVWFCREKLYYKSDKYLDWINCKPFKNYIWRSMQI